MRRTIIPTAALLLAVATLTGCGDDGAAASTTAAPTTQAPATTTAPATTAAEEPPETVPEEEPAVEFTLASPVFDDGGNIPVGFTCDGANDSPELVFAGVPAGTTSLALTVIDPDGQDWIHWIAWNLPADSAGLPMNVPAGDLPDGTRQGANDFAGMTGEGGTFPQGGGTIRVNGWDGPCPGSSPHRYVFTLYALTGTIDLPTGTPGIDVWIAIEQARADGSLIGEATLTGMYPPG
ncbi:MAG: YbhB/YbcL family Raf kinase inhibitor-like protein [Actinobacteria bacterium]|nr:YbhB/YbcL family Raf kinase inhibitor-like protein [Actinomycetota bacterium]